MSDLVWNGDPLEWNGDQLVFNGQTSAIVFPTIPGTRVQRTLATSSALVTSPFTGTQQVQDWGGEWWEYTVDLAIRRGAEGRALSAIFAQMRGSIKPFLFRDPFVCQTGSYGVPTVNGSGQTGNSLVTDGWSVTGLNAGDFFSLGSDLDTRFYQLTADVTPVGGAATLEFVPALRSSPSDNEALEVNEPKVLLRATSPLPTSITPSSLYSFSIQAREAI